MTDYLIVFAFLTLVWFYGFCVGMLVEHTINERKRKKQE